MNNNFRKFLIGIIVVVGICALGAKSVNAQGTDSLTVQFEKNPLFSEANFLPGDSIARWARVTNNSGQTERIAVEAINVSDPNDLGDALRLEIKQGANQLFDNSLAAFFDAGEVYLSDLNAGGGYAQYDFIVSFYNESGNPLQGKTLGFDIIIGFQGAEGGLTPGGGSGSGGSLPSGLIITNESTTEVGQTSVTISWLTSYASTSQVIYGKEGEAHTLNLSDSAGTPPKYGYAHTTVESDTSPKVISHSITITGLESGVTYYYRAVSHGSFAVSLEHSFMTLTGSQEISLPDDEMLLDSGLSPEVLAGQDGGQGQGTGLENSEGMVYGERDENGNVALNQGLDGNSQEEELGGEEQGSQLRNFAVLLLASLIDIKMPWFWFLIALILVFLYYLYRKIKEKIEKRKL